MYTKWNQIYFQSETAGILQSLKPQHHDEHSIYITEHTKNWTIPQLLQITK